MTIDKEFDEFDMEFEAIDSFYHGAISFIIEEAKHNKKGNLHSYHYWKRFLRLLVGWDCFLPKDSFATFHTSDAYDSVIGKLAEELGFGNYYREREKKKQKLQHFLSACFVSKIYFVRENGHFKLKKDKGEIPLEIKNMFPSIERDLDMEIGDADIASVTREHTLFTMINEKTLCEILGVEREYLIKTIYSKDTSLEIPFMALCNENGELSYFFDTRKVPEIIAFFDKKRKGKIN